jgi:hypothetical protein
MEITIKDIRPEFKIIEDVKDEPTLKSAQEFVGGYVEGISFPNGDYLIINEEGKLIGLPINEDATKLWKDTFDNDDYITGRKDWVAGNAILIKKQALKRWAAEPKRAPPNAPPLRRLRRRGSIEVPTHFQNPNLLLV